MSSENIGEIISLKSSSEISTQTDGDIPIIEKTPEFILNIFV